MVTVAFQYPGSVDSAGGSQYRNILNAAMVSEPGLMSDDSVEDCSMRTQHNRSIRVISVRRRQKISDAITQTDRRN